MGIGVHTGVVVVGNIGSDRRTDFTAVGDAVNVAHRLEKLARPGEILVSEAVQRRIRGAVSTHFEGERQLSGREEPVHVYSIQADAKAAALFDPPDRP
jgi:class 3 adenylate cyclase